MTLPPLMDRVKDLVRSWNIAVTETLRTDGAFVAFGRRGTQPVVLKVLHHRGDEWRSGDVLDAFGGEGMVRVYERADGALLLERLVPGTSLSVLALDGRDEDATEIIADVVRRMTHRREAPAGIPSAEDWGLGFGRYLASGDARIPVALVERAQALYAGLAASQRAPRLLHGDLQHYNVLFDADRGWLAIDPKGVIGDIEYEIGATLRNPVERPELFASPAVIERRLAIMQRRLGLDADRALRWGFAQAVLSAIWALEDGAPVHATRPPLLLASAILALLGEQALPDRRLDA